MPNVPIDTIFLMLSDRIAEAQGAGYVITGELQVTKPKVPGLISVQANGIKLSEEHGRLELVISKIKPLNLKEQAKTVTTTGEICPECGNMMTRTGTCYTCSVCAHNTGCG